MSIIKTRHLGLVGVISLAFGLGTSGCSGCSEETPVSPDTADAGTHAEIEQDETSAPAAVVDFYVETAQGPALTGETTSAAFDLKSDKYPGVAKAGVQVDVVVATENVPDGAVVAVLIDNVQVGKAGSVKDGAARIDEITIPCSTQPLSFAVQVTVDGQATVKSKNVTLDCDDACVATIEAPPSCLVTDVDPQTPGFQYTFVVSTASAGCTHAYIEYTDVNGKKGETQKIALAGPKAAVKVTLAGAATGHSNAHAQVVAVVEDQSHPERPTLKSDSLDVTVTTENPVITITQPVPGSLSLADDADPLVAGLQTTLVGTATSVTTADTDAITLLVDGVSQTPTTLKVDGTFSFDVTFLASKTYSLKVQAVNGCQLVGETTVEYQVFVDAATLQITTPAAEAKLLAKADGDTATQTLYETTFEVELTKATAGSTVSIVCRTNLTGSVFAAAPVGTAKVDSAATTKLSIPVVLDTAILGTGIVCKAVDDAPNASSSAEVGFTVGLPPPCLTIALPKDGAVFSGDAVEVFLAGTHLNGQEVTARVLSDSGATFVETVIGKLAAGSLLASVPLLVGDPAAKLPDGSYTLQVDATDEFGNIASDSACSAVSRSFSLDATGPQLQVTLPAKATLDSLKDVDVSDAPGYQTDVVVQVDGEADASKVEVCLSVGGFGVGCLKPAEGAQTVTFAAVSLQPGSNSLVVSGTDAIGNKTANEPLNVDLVSNAVVVKWLKPTGNTTIATTALELRVKVTDQKTGAPIDGVTGQVLLNGAAADTNISAAPNGVYEATLSGLNADVANTIQFIATPQAGGTPGVSPVLVVTVKTSKPTTEITNPKAGTLFNLANQSCVEGVSNCVTTVIASTENTEDGSAAELTAICSAKPAAPVTATTTVQSGVATFTQFALLDNSKCSLTVTITDKAGQQVVSQSIEVDVDRTAPQVTKLVSPKALLLASDDVNQNPSDGMQILVQVSASALPAASVITLEVFDDDGKAADGSPFTSKPHADIGVGSIGSVSFGTVSLPDGNAVKLKFSAVDLAGNVGTLEVTITVVSAQPDVLINGSQPPYVAPIACTASSQCGAGVCSAGQCLLAWNKNGSKALLAFAVGLPEGADIRVCSDLAGLSGDACATAGYTAVAVSKISNGSGNFNLAGIVDGVHTLIVEASSLPAVDWTSSLKAKDVSQRQRRILVDTVAPEVNKILAPEVAGVPAGCLADKSQSVPDQGIAGGKFTFAVTTKVEEATISLMANGVTVGSQATKSKLAGVSVQLPEGSVAISAAPIDLAGNVGSSVSAGTYNVNTVAPVGKFAAPTAATLIVGDTLDVQITSAATDIEGQDVILQDGGLDKATKAFAAGVAVFDDATYGVLTDGSHTLTAVLADKCGNTATIATIPPTVVVDTQPPTVDIQTPAAAAQFIDKDDASTDLGGYQVSVSFTTTGAKTWELELGSGCDAQFGACAGHKTVGGGAITNSGGAEPAVLVTPPFGKVGPYYYSVRVTATDLNGNVTTVESGFEIALTSCIVLVNGLPLGDVNTALCPAPGSNCSSVTLPVSVEYLGPCGAVANVKLFLKDIPAAVATAAPLDSIASLSLTLQDGYTGTLEAKLVDAGDVETATSGPSNLNVDLTLPVVVFEAVDAGGFTTPASGETVLWGQPDDQDLVGQVNHQFHAHVKVTDDGLIGGKLVKLERVVNGVAEALPVVQPSQGVIFDSKIASFDIQNGTVPENQTSLVRATVQDKSGNKAVATFTATVDWVAPAQLSLDALTTDNVNPRRPMVRLTFKSVGDNGDSGSAATKYEVRYSKKKYDDDYKFEDSCDAAALTASAIGAPAQPNLDDQIIVEGPDGRASSDPCKFAPLTDNGATKYYFAARAIDEAGNAGTVSAQLETDLVRLHFAKVTPTGGVFAAGKSYHHRVYGLGDLNGDGKGDVAVGGYDVDFCIIYGYADQDMAVADFVLDAASGAGHQCLTNAGGMGAIVPQGVDVNGDGIDDLVISELKDPNRKVNIFLGKKDAKLDLTKPAVTITGLSNFSVLPGAAWLSSAGNFTGDVNAVTDKPIGDLAIRLIKTGPVPYERIMILPGSSIWSADVPTSINLESQSDRDTHHIGVVYLTDLGASSYLYGITPMGNLLPDPPPPPPAPDKQYDELAFAVYASDQQVVILKGQDLVGETVFAISKSQTGAGPADGLTIRIRPSSDTGLNGFNAAQRVDCDGDNVPDLAVGHQPSGSAPTHLYWVRGVKLQSQLGKVVSLAGTPVAGADNLNALGTTSWFTKVPFYYGKAAGNFGDQTGGGARTALISGMPPNASGIKNKVWVRMAIPRAAPAGAFAAYAYEDLEIGNPFDPDVDGFGSGVTFGVSTAGVGDFNGDGYPDLLVGTAQSAHAVLVY